MKRPSGVRSLCAAVGGLNRPEARLLEPVATRLVQLLVGLRQARAGQAELEAVRVHARVAAPAVEHTLVPADVDVAGRDRVEQLGENCLEEPHGLRERGNQVRQDPPVGGHLKRPARVGPELGQNYIIDSFLVVVTGGVGKLLGSILAAIGIGGLNKLIEPSLGAVFGKVLMLVLVIVFIQRRPSGLFATKGRYADA